MNNIAGYEAISASVREIHDEYIDNIKDLAVDVYEEIIEPFLEQWEVVVKVSSVDAFHDWYLYFPQCGEPVDSLMETAVHLPADLPPYVSWALVEQYLPILHVEVDGGEYFDLGDYIFRYHLDKHSLKS